MDMLTAQYGTHGWRDALRARCVALPPVAVAVAHPCDAHALAAAADAASLGLVTLILVGPEAKIHAAAKAAKLDISAHRIEDVRHSHAAADRGVALVRSGEAQMLMKGSLHIDEFMHAVMATDTGLRTKRRISHVYVMDVPRYPRPILITDAAVNVTPSLDDKREIAQNAIDHAHVLGILRPRVAILAPVEVVNPKLPSTLDTAALCKITDRGQITGALLDGPLAFDNAISLEAATEKGIVSDVAGRADILVVPNLVSGNILAMQLTFLSGADAAGVVVGAKVPIILTSGAGSEAVRIASCAVAVLMAHAAQSGASATDADAAPAGGAVFEAIETRRSVRGYVDKPVPREVVERLLSAASRAPSGNNSQPWRVHVLTGAGRQQLTDAIMAARAAGGDDPEPERARSRASWRGSKGRSPRRASTRTTLSPSSEP
jgi:phosphotransacetylase